MSIDFIKTFENKPVGVKLAPYFDMPHYQKVVDILSKYPIKFMEYQDGDQPYLNYLHVLRDNNIISQSVYESLILRNKKNNVIKSKK